PDKHQHLRSTATRCRLCADVASATRQSCVDRLRARSRRAPRSDLLHKILSWYQECHTRHGVCARERGACPKRLARRRAWTSRPITSKEKYHHHNRHRGSSGPTHAPSVTPRASDRTEDSVDRSPAIRSKSH